MVDVVEGEVAVQQGNREVDIESRDRCQGPAHVTRPNDEMICFVRRVYQPVRLKKLRDYIL